MTDAAKLDKCFIEARRKHLEFTVFIGNLNALVPVEHYERLIALASRAVEAETEKVTSWEPTAHKRIKGSMATECGVDDVKKQWSTVFQWTYVTCPKCLANKPEGVDEMAFV